MNSETAKTDFFYQLKKYGIKKFLTQSDSIVLYVVFLLLSTDRLFKLNLFVVSDKTLIISIFAAASTLFAITLAALAIILSFSKSRFMLFLQKNDKLSPLLFLFWIGNGAYLLVIMLSVIYFVLNVEFMNNIIYILIVSIFSYSLVNTTYLLATVMRFGYFIDIFEKIANNKPK